MFDALKKKFSSWFSDKKEEKKKTSKKAGKNEKKEKKESKIVKEKVKKEKIKKTSEEKIEESIGEEIEESVKEEESEEPEEKKGFFSKLMGKISSSTATMNQENIDGIFSEIEITLLENNVALEVVDKIKENLIKDLLGIEVKKDKIEKTIFDSLKKSILEVLIEPPNLIENINKKIGPYTIIFFGINGSGKTTSIAKLANLLKKSGISCVLAAADTFRAASIEQLEKHADNLGLPIIKHTYGSDPAAVAFDAKKYAEAHKIKVVLIDTAGRMYTKQNLIKEMEKIIRISKPDLKIFVGESITGNDAVEQAKTFNEAVGIDGIILTKADVDEKAGTILSVSYVTQKPIYFLGTGQEYSDFTPFTKDSVLKNLGLD
ncbi:MAG: signal recognition particle-docking protein FtsY [archaeon]|nr:signal recognition particle-docking protein FtsY [archaeon]